MMETQTAEMFQLLETTMYWIAAFLFLIAAAFAAYRVYQMHRGLRLVMAEVLESRVASSQSVWHTHDMQGMAQDSYAKTYSAKAQVRYTFAGTEYITEASSDTSTTFRGPARRLAESLRPGNRIRAFIDPSKPEKPTIGLGYNFLTFLPSFLTIVAGMVFVLIGKGVPKLAEVVLPHFRFPGAV